MIISCSASLRSSIREWSSVGAASAVVGSVVEARFVGEVEVEVDVEVGGEVVAAGEVLDGFPVWDFT